MRAAVFAGPGSLVLEDRPRPELAATDEVIVEVEACGVCGTDLHILATPPGHPATPGTILGHELVGRIVEAGPDAREARVGQRVVVDSDPKCGACGPCRAGRPAECDNVVAVGIFRDGGLASHVSVPASATFGIADAVPAPIAALAEPLACVVNATRRAALRVGESVVVLGGGAIGCLFTAVFRASGASFIIVVEPNSDRAQVAREVGADLVVRPDELPDAMEERLPAGADVVVDAVGSLFGTATEAAARGGRVVLFGMDSNARPSIHQVRITERSLTVLGSYIANFTYPDAVRLLEGGRLRLEPIISAVLPLERIEDGLDALRDGTATKVVLTP